MKKFVILLAILIGIGAGAYLSVGQKAYGQTIGTLNQWLYDTSAKTLTPRNASSTLVIPQYATTTSPNCLKVDTAGNVSVTSGCGSGGGGGSTATTTINGLLGPNFTFATSSISGTFNISTSSVNSTVTFNFPNNVLTTGNLQGTATQVGFFTGPNTVNSDSNLYWDNTNKALGVGGTPGSEILFVGGKTGINTTTGASTLHVVAGGGQSPFTVASSSGTSFLTVTSSGNVGIGTTSPAQLLTVYGGNGLFINSGSLAGQTGLLNVFVNSPSTNQVLFKVGSSNSNNQFVVQDNLQVSFGAGLKNTGTLTMSGGSAAINTDQISNQNIQIFDASSNLRITSNSSQATTFFSGASTEIMRVNGTGLGIGTTTPGALLVVGDGANTTAPNGINFGDATANLYRSAAGTVKSDGTVNAATLSVSNLSLNGSSLTINANVSSNITSQFTNTTQGYGLTLKNTGNRTVTANGSDNGQVQIGTDGLGIFQPASGSANFAALQIQQTYNQTGSASGLTRGIWINPTVTKAVDFRALEVAGYIATTTQTTLAYGSLFNAPTFATTAAATLANAQTVTLTGAPLAGPNMTITSSTALTLQGGAVNGGGTITNAQSLYVQAPTGATNNYAAILMGGNVGIGTTTPSQALQVVGSINNTLNAGSGMNIVSTTTTNDSNLKSVIGSGRYVYVHSNTTGYAAVMDISNPASPSFVATTSVFGFSNPQTARSMAISGRYLYSVGPGSTFKTIDLINPRNPVIASTFTLTDAPGSVYIVGHYAYVVAGTGTTSKLIVVDISNPYASVQVAAATLTATSTTLMYDVIVQGRYAYALNHNDNTMYVVDVGNPLAPLQAATISVVTQPAYMAIVGHYAYIAGNSTSISVIDISNPTAPTALPSLNLGFAPSGEPFAAGRYIYFGSTAVDVSNPAAPVKVSSVTMPVTVYGPYVVGHYAYLAGGSDGNLYTVDLTGTETTALTANTADIGQLSVRNDLQVTGNIQLQGGLNVGAGGIFSDGALAVGSSTSVSFINGKLGIGTTTPNATLHVYGSNAFKYTKLATSVSTYNIATSTDNTIYISTTTIASTINLPSCQSSTDQIEYIVKDLGGNAGTNNITVTATAGNTVDGAATKVINSNYGSTKVQCVNGSGWFTLP